MRDLFVFGLVMLSLPMAFRRPFVGLLLFSWLAYMRPQDLCWSFARPMRFSFIVGMVMIVGWFVNESHARRFWRPDLRTILMVVLVVLTSVGLATAKMQNEWVMRYYLEFVKIMIVALFTTGQVDTKARLRTLLWTIAICLGFFGFKGGVWCFLNGGLTILRGPGGMLEDNNDFALALVMNIPLLFYLGRSEKTRWIRTLTNITIFLTIVTVLCTHSRGSFVALTCMSFLMAWRSQYLLRGLGFFALLVLLFFTFAPEHVMERVASIAEGTSDSSAGARIAAWTVAARMIVEFPLFGVGLRNFQMHWQDFSYGVFQTGGGGKEFTYVAHNSYLQIWAEAGTFAFAVYVVLLLSVFFVCYRMRRMIEGRPDMEWAWFYARMFEATTFGFMIGAVFLNRGHFDLLYHWIALISCMFVIVKFEYARGHNPEQSQKTGIRWRWRTADSGPGMLPKWGR